MLGPWINPGYYLWRFAQPSSSWNVAYCFVPSFGPLRWLTRCKYSVKIWYTRSKGAVKKPSGTIECAQTKKTARPMGTQTPPARSLGLLCIARWRPYYRVLCMEFASRQHLVHTILMRITDFRKIYMPLLQTTFIQHNTNCIPRSRYRTVAQTMFHLKWNNIYWIVYPWMHEFSKNLTATFKI